MIPVGVGARIASSCDVYELGATPVFVARFASGPKVEFRYRVPLRPTSSGEWFLASPFRLANLRLALRSWFSRAQTSRRMSAIDSLGWKVDVRLRTDEVTVTAAGPAVTGVEALRLLVEQIVAAELDERVLELEPGVLQEISTGLKDAAGTTVQKELGRRLYGDSHPYAGVWNYPEGYDAYRLTVDAAYELMSRWCRFDGSVASIVFGGGLSAKDVESAVARLADAPWQFGGVAVPRPSPPVGEVVWCSVEAPKGKTLIRAGSPCPSRSDGAYFGTVVANAVVGGSPVARLAKALQHELGGAYRARSIIGHQRRFSGLYISVDLPGEYEKENIANGFLAKLSELLSYGVKQSEVRQAKCVVLGGLQTEFDTQSSLADYLVDCAFLPGGVEYFDKLRSGVESVSAEEVRGVLGSILDVDRIVVVAS